MDKLFIEQAWNIGGWALTCWVIHSLYLIFKSDYDKRHEDDTTRKRLIGDLYQNKAKNRYRRFMSRLMDRFDTWLGGTDKERTKSPLNVAFTEGLARKAIALAFAYPMLSALINWFLGNPIAFANTILVAAGMPWDRGILAILFTLSTVVFFRPMLKSPALDPSIISALAILYMPYLIDSFTPLDIFDNPEVAFAGAIAGAIAIAGSGAFAGAFAGVIAVTVTLAVVGAGAVAFAFAGVIAFASKQHKYGAHAIDWLILIIFALSALAIGVTHWSDTSNTNGLYFTLFFAIFPLFNALADFASIGLTRYLLRLGLNDTPNSTEKTKSVAPYAILDLIGAAIIFALLGCSLITYIHYVRPMDGTQLLDLTGLFKELKTDPAQYWWLGFLLFTTLLPTIFHAGVALYAFVFLRPVWLRQVLISGLKSNEPAQRQTANRFDLFLFTVVLWFVFWIAWTTITHIPKILNHIIAFFETYAQFIGAI